MPLAPHQIGIDENGLGPRLGPMVVTAVRVALDPGLLADEAAWVTVATRAGIGDSKAACKHNAMGGVEGAVLALLEAHLGLCPATLTELITALGVDPEAVLRADCPSGAAPEACFRDPVTLPAFGPGPTERHRTAARALRDAGAVLTAARVGVVCAKRMNLARRAGRSRFDLDLDLMVRLAGVLRGAADGPPVVAVCGKVGGRKSYGSALTPLGVMAAVLTESPRRSSYRVPGFGEVHFIMDGDATEPAIGLASLVGKYVRELWMHRLNRYWLAAVPTAVPASGYHDPVTARLVAATELTRRARAIPDECFER